MCGNDDPRGIAHVCMQDIRLEEVHALEKPVILIGAGGQALVLAECLQLLQVDVLGIIDKYPLGGGRTPCKLPFLGTDEDMAAYPPTEVMLVNGIGSVGSTVLRQRIYERYHALGYAFRSVIHPTAVVSPMAALGEGVQIFAGAVIGPDARIGDDTIINTRTSVDHECRIGAHSHLAPGCTLSGGVTVGVGVHIGTGTSVIQGCRIGDGTTVGAGSLVLHDIPDHVLAYGVPARIVRSLK